MRADSQFAGFGDFDPEADQNGGPRDGQEGPNSQAAATLAGQIQSLKARLSHARFFQCDDLTVRSLADQVESAQPGDLVYYNTGQHDPVAFAATALARGASGILTEQLLPCPLPQVIVGDAPRTACRIASELAGRPDQQLLTIGVIGDSGKTSTAILIAGMLRKLGLRTAYETDLGCSDGVVQSTSKAPIASGLRLIAKAGEANEAAAQVMVVELAGPNPGAADGLQFDILVVTGSSPQATSGDQNDHFGPDPLSQALEQTKPDAVLLTPADHPQLIRRIDETGLPQVTYGLRRAADLSAKVFEEQPGETTLMVSCGDETAVMQTRHCGEAMAMNSLAAIATAVMLQTPLPQAIGAICDLPQLPGRMQRLTGFDSAAVVIDSAGTPQRLASSLRALRRQRPSGGKLWCVLAIDGYPDTACPDTGRSETGNWKGQTVCYEQQLAQAGQWAERFADHLILTSTRRAKATFLPSAHAVLDGFKNVAFARLVADQRRAVQWAINHAEPCDTILIVTGPTADTAYGQRKAIGQLEALVKNLRKTGDIKRETTPSTIKMF